MVARAEGRTFNLKPMLYFLVLPVALYVFAQSSYFARAHELIDAYLLSSDVETAAMPAPVRPLPQTTLKNFENISKTNPNEKPEIPELLPLDFASREVTREDILNDKFNRVPEAFRLQAGLRQRVGFWFDIYTRYSSRFHVIHHVDFPWIIYKVIDTTKVFTEDPVANKWTKYHRALALVKKEQALIRSELYKLARMKKYDNLTADQQRYFDILQELPGSRKSVFLAAAANIRAQLGQKDFYRNGLVNGSKYLPQMEEIFAHYDLPVELTRLPLVESSFNEKATSKVGASGIWQFMPLVGKTYLKVTDGIDERNSPLKATEAAAKLMMLNFKITQNWPMAITAYNHGATGIMRASKKARSTDMATIIDRYSSHSFGFASSNFFCSFLAALYGERYQEAVFGDIPKFPPHRAENIRLTQSFKAQTLADVAGVTMEELKLYNQDLKSKALRPYSILPAGYRVFLPEGRRARVELYAQEKAASQKIKTAFKRQASKSKKRIRVSIKDRSDKRPRL